jgi:hypothetical protein
MVVELGVGLVIERTSSDPLAVNEVMAQLGAHAPRVVVRKVVSDGNYIVNSNVPGCGTV